MKRKIIYGVLIVLLLIQLIRIDTVNPEVNIADDFIEIANPPQEIAVMLKSACYDCHSNESTYPWYSNIAPVSWWVKHHINEAREELNFSKWSTFTEKRKDHKLEEMVEEVEEGEMPLKPYPITHPDAQLSDAQKEQLITWFKKIRKEAKEKKEKPTLQLNDGTKWVADVATNDAVAKMLTIINQEFSGDISTYQEAGATLSTEMKALFGVCTMKGPAHDQLHIFLVPLVKKYRDLGNVDTEEEAIVLQEEILNQLNLYAEYFQ